MISRRRLTTLLVLAGLQASCGGATPNDATATKTGAAATELSGQTDSDASAAEPEPPSTLARADITGTALAQDETQLYFAGPPLAGVDGEYENAEGDLVWAVAKKGGAPIPLFDAPLGPVKGVAVSEGQVLFTVSGTLVLSAKGDMTSTSYRKGQVVRVSTGAKGTTVLARNQAEPMSIATAAGRAYWISQANDTGERSAIRSAPISGGKTKNLAQGQTSPVAIAADARHVFWLSLGEGDEGWETQVWRIGADGGKVRKLATLPGEPGAIAVAGEKVFVASSDRIARVPYDGGDPIVLDEDLSEPRGVAVDDEHVYWTDRGRSTVKRAAIAGGKVTVLAVDQREPGGIAVDDRAVYWMVKGAIRKLVKVVRPASLPKGASQGSPQAKAGPAEPEPADPFAPLAEPDDGPASLPAGASQGGTTSSDESQDVDPEQLPHKWLKCKKDKQCVLIETGCCLKVGVHKKFRKQARKQLPGSTCDAECDYGKIKAVCEDRNCRAVIQP